MKCPHCTNGKVKLFTSERDCEYCNGSDNLVEATDFGFSIPIIINKIELKFPITLIIEYACDDQIKSEKELKQILLNYESVHIEGWKIDSHSMMFEIEGYLYSGCLVSPQFIIRGIDSHPKDWIIYLSTILKQV